MAPFGVSNLRTRPLRNRSVTNLQSSNRRYNIIVVAEKAIGDQLEVTSTGLAVVGTVAVLVGVRSTRTSQIASGRIVAVRPTTVDPARDGTERT